MKPQKKALLQALENSLGVVTTACKQADISRDTHYRWIREDEEYKEAVEDLSNVALDFAESQLFKQIKDGNTTATIFFLKTKGKHRGYIERQELDHTSSDGSMTPKVPKTMDDWYNPKRGKED